MTSSSTIQSLPTTAAPPPHLKARSPDNQASALKRNTSHTLDKDAVILSLSTDARSQLAKELVNKSSKALAEPPTQDTLEQDTLGQSAPSLSPEERAVIARLKARDREVRNHEQAHAMAGAGYTSAPQYEFVTGPDGRKYAVGGHVDIDTAPVAGNPRATIAKLEIVRAAALAPANPSGPDRGVAASAERAVLKAESQLKEIENIEASEKSDQAYITDNRNKFQNPSANTYFTRHERPQQSQAVFLDLSV